MIIRVVVFDIQFFSPLALKKKKEITNCVTRGAIEEYELDFLYFLLSQGFMA
jgi:hypothetical protein